MSFLSKLIIPFKLALLISYAVVTGIYEGFEMNPKDLGDSYDHRGSAYE